MLGNDASSNDESAGTLTLLGGNVLGGTYTIDGVSQQTGLGLDDVFASVAVNPDTGITSGQLADNGGPVQTIALKDGATNPAIDAGNDAATGVPTADARGALRADFPGAPNFDNGTNISDLGAYELTHNFVVTTFDDVVDPSDGLTSLREAVDLANGIPGADTITFDDALGTGAVTLGAALSLDDDVTIDVGSHLIEIGGAAIGGPGGLTKIGAEFLFLSGLNTYAGGTHIAAGPLAVGNNGALGTGDVAMVAGTTLGFGENGIFLANDINITGDPAVDVGTGDFDVLTGDITDSGPGPDPGTLEKTGFGLLLLAGANTYSGPTVVAAGTLAAASGTGFSSASAFQVASGAVLDVNTFSMTIGSLADSGGTGGIVRNGDTAGATLTTGNDNSSTSFSGTIEDGPLLLGLALTKIGTGTQILSGTSTCTGPTTISGGILEVDGTIVSATTVDSGGTLAGKGTVGGVTVASGGALSPGASPGILHAGNVNLSAGASFKVELGGTTAGNGAGHYDQLDIHGTVALGGATLNASLFGGFDPETHTGAQFVIVNNDGTDTVTGIFAGLADGAHFTIGGSAFSITYQGGSNNNDVVLTALNDAPTASHLTQSKAYTEGAASVALDDIVVSDVDSGDTITATLTLATPAAGTLTTSGGGSYTAGTGVWTVSGTVAQVNAALAAVSFTPAANNDLDTTITTHIRDAANTGPTDGTIALDVTPLNDAPTASHLTQSKAYTEGAASVALDDIVVSDVDSSDTITATLTLATPAAGTLTTSGGGSYTAGTGVWTVSGTVAQVNAALAAVSFTPAANNDLDTTITTHIRDAANTGPTDGTIALDVTPLNDAPTATDKTLTILEDISHVFSAADFGFRDPKDNPANSLLAVKITTLPAAGTLTDNGLVVSAGDFIPVAHINGGKLVFSPAANANGTGYASFTVQVKDNGGTVNGGVDTDQSPNTITVNVTPVNDAPVITSNGGHDAAAISVAENTKPVTHVAATDIDGGALVYSIAGGADASDFTIDSGSGVLSFKNAPDFEAPTGANHDNAYQVVVKVADGHSGSDMQSLSITVTNVAGVTIIGSNHGDLVDATHSAHGQPLPTGEEDVIRGGKGDDDFAGLGGNDRMRGGKGDDWVKGGDGDDTLAGRLGKNKLSGGEGNDSFVFDTKVGAGKEGHNAWASFSYTKITDFSPGEDVITLDHTVFKALDLGTLAHGEFHLGSKAKDGDDHILYEANTGALYYDHDGKGGDDAVQFASVAKHLDLDTGSFFVS